VVWRCVIPLLGELVVNFSANLTDFTAGITQAQTLLTDFGTQVDAVSQSFSSTLSTAAASAGTAVSSSVSSAGTSVASSSASMNSAFSSVVSAFSSASSGVAEFATSVMGSLSEAGASVAEFASGIGESLQESYHSFVDFGNQIGETVNSLTEMQFAGFKMVQGLVASDAEMEQTKIAFKTLLGSSQAAGTYLTQLWNFAAKTPFQFQNLAGASQQLIAFGFKAKDTIPDLTTMGDALSAMGRTDAGSLQQIVGVFGRIQAASKVNAMDMNMLTFLGIPGWKYLAQAMHMTVTQVQELSRTGKLTSEQAIPALISGMHQAFGGAMAAQAVTFNGLLTTIKDNLIAAWRTISGPLFDQAKMALKAFGDLAGSPVFQNFAKVIAGVLAQGFALLGSVLNSTVVPAFKTLFGFFGQIASVGGNLLPHMDFTSITNGVTQLRGAFAGLISSLTGLVGHFTMTKGAGDGLRAFMAQALVGAMSIASGVMRLFTQGLQILTGIINQLRPTLQQVASILSGTFVQAFNQLRTATGSQLNAGFELFGNILKQVGEWAKSSLVPALQQLLPVLARLGSSIVSNVVPIMINFRDLVLKIAEVALPPLMGILGFIIPVALRLASVIGGILTGAFNIIGPIVAGFISGLTKMITFFQQNEIAGALLKGVLIAIAIPLGLLAMVLLPMLIADMVGSLIGAIVASVGGFFAMAGALWTAAAGMIALTWPILLVILAVGILIAIVVLVVQHWNQIVAFFQGLWAKIVGFFQSNANTIMNILKVLGAIALVALTGPFGIAALLIMTHINQIKQFFSDLGTHLRQFATATKNFVGDKFNDLGTTMRTAATNTKNWVGDRFNSLGTTLHDAGVGAVKAGQWMYQHNTYWKAAVDDVTKAFNDTKAKVIQIAGDIKTGVGNFFDGLGTHLREIATNIKNDVGGAFDWLGTHLNEAANFVKTNVGNAFDWLGTHLRQIATDIKNNVGNFFSQMGEKVKSVIDDLKIGVEYRFLQLGQLVNQAVAWLQVNVISKVQAMVSGFLDRIGQLKDQAIALVQGFVSNFLGTIGGLASQLWSAGANLIGMLISGIESKLGDLAGAVGQAAGKLASILGFHSPTEEGPGSDADTWMPNLMTMMTSGMIGGIPNLQKAALLAASSVRGALSMALPISSSIGVNSSFFAQGAANAAKSGTANIYVQLDSKLIGQSVGQPIADYIRVKTGVHV